MPKLRPRLSGLKRSELAAILSNFASATGTNLLALAQAASLVERGLPLEASLVLVATCLPPMLVAGAVGSWIDRHARRRHIVLLEMIVAALSFLTLALAEEGYLTGVLLAIAARAVAAFSVRASLVRSIKYSAAGGSQIVVMKLFQTGMLLSVFAAGLIASLPACFATTDAPPTVGLIAAHTAALSLLFMLPRSPLGIGVPCEPRPVGRKASVFAGLCEILREPSMRRAALVVVAGQLTFQTAEMTLVAFGQTVLPSRVAMPTLQISVGIGLLAGMILALAFPALLGAPLRDHRTRPGIAAAVGVISLALALSTKSPVMAALTVAAMCAAYELLDASFGAAFFAAVPRSDVARLHASLRATATGAMAGAILIVGSAISCFGPIVTGVAGCVVTAVLWSLVVTNLPSRSGTRPATQSPDPLIPTAERKPQGVELSQRPGSERCARIAVGHPYGNRSRRRQR